MVSSPSVRLAQFRHSALTSSALNLGSTAKYPVVGRAYTPYSPSPSTSLKHYLSQPYRIYALPWKIYVGKNHPLCIITDTYSQGWFGGDHSAEHCKSVLTKRQCVFIKANPQSFTIHFLTDTNVVQCIGYRDPVSNPGDWASLYSFSENPRSIVDSQPLYYYRTENYTILPAVALSTCVVLNSTHSYPQNVFLRDDSQETYIPISKFYTSTHPTLGGAVDLWHLPVKARGSEPRTSFMTDYSGTYTSSWGPVIGFSPNAYAKICHESRCFTAPRNVPPFYILDSYDPHVLSTVYELQSWHPLYAHTHYAIQEEVTEGSSSFIDVLLLPYTNFLFGMLGDGFLSLSSRILKLLFETPLRPFLCYLSLSYLVFFYLTGSSYFSILLSISVLYVTH